MRIISNAHIDSHAALLALICGTIPKIEARLDEARADLTEARRLKAEFEAQPWYKRWFALAEPDLYHARWVVDANAGRLTQIKKIQSRASFEVTIELDSVESDLVFYGHE
jgi:hypothetical protein